MNHTIFCSRGYMNYTLLITVSFVKLLSIQFFATGNTTQDLSSSDE